MALGFGRHSHSFHILSMRTRPVLQLYERFRSGQKAPANLGPSRDYNVDMIPKFIMNSGELVSTPCSCAATMSLKLLLGAAHTCRADLGVQGNWCSAWLITPPSLQVRVLVHTDVTKYLEFKGVDGSFVLNKGRVEKVPATDYEALRSPLLGLFEKRRLRSFLL